MKKPLIIFGTGEIADVAHYYFTHDGERQVAAFTSNASHIIKPTFHKLPVMMFEDIERHYGPDEYEMFIGVGYSKVNAVRKEKYLAAKAKGYKLASYISSKANILCDVQAIGDNSFILEQNNIQPFVRIGSNVTLWSGNHIGHHSVIEDHSFITSHVVVSGGVKIGEHSFIGVNATLRDHITIGKRCVIGAGAYISANTEDDSVYPGQRATPLAVKSGELEDI